MPPERETSQTEAAQESLKLAFRLLAQVGFLTIGVLLLALFGGQWLDATLGTGRTFTVTLLLASFPASLYIIYRIALRTIAQIKPAPQRGRRVKEESDSDDTDAAS
jgi:hypothetical protein